MGFQYNGKLRAPELLVRQAPEPGQAPAVHLIRDREVKEVLFSNTRMPADLALGLPKAYPYHVTGEAVARGTRLVAYAAVAVVLASAAVLAGRKALAK